MAYLCCMCAVLSNVLSVFMPSFSSKYLTNIGSLVSFLFLNALGVVFCENFWA